MTDQAAPTRPCVEKRERPQFQIYGRTPRQSSEKFPPYRHIPGVTPHPVRDADGHSFGLEEGDPPPWNSKRWRESSDYLYGVDLYNHAYYWEAHEAWEAIWKVARKERNRLFLQGLIQVSAGLLKREVGNWQGLEKLTRKGLAKLQQVAEVSEHYGGLHIPPFCARIQQISSRRVYPGWVADPRILLRDPPESPSPNRVE